MTEANERDLDDDTLDDPLDDVDTESIGGDMELPGASPADEGDEPSPDTRRFGDAEDASDEHPLLIDDAEAGPDAAPSELASAYACLELRTPLQEFEAYARARLETLVRLGEAGRAERAREALDLGQEALRRVMTGATGREAP